MASMDAQLDPTGRRDLLRWLLASVPAAAHLDAWAGPPSNYPDSYPVIAAAARDEGKVVVYSTTDLSAVAALIRDFEQCYPGIRVEYNDLNSAELHQRYLAEAYARVGRDSCNFTPKRA